MALQVLTCSTETDWLPPAARTQRHPSPLSTNTRFNRYLQEEKWICVLIHMDKKEQWRFCNRIHMLVKIKWVIQTNHCSWFKPIFYAENWILPQTFPASSSIYFSTVRIWVICCGIPFLFENVCELASGSDFVNTCETVFTFSVPSPLTGIVIPSVPGAYSLTIRVNEETWGDFRVFSLFYEDSSETK